MKKFLAMRALPVGLKHCWRPDASTRLDEGNV